jgi:predicted nucleotide-binding protein
MGYFSKASELAATVKSALTDEALSVMDWATDFVPGRTIMQEVARAAQLCRTGLFLFTADDPINSESTPTIVPRDNVLLEAGYFASSKSLSRVLIVREKGVNMPADLGGIIYHTFDSKDQWPTAVRAAAHSIRRMIQADAAA